jgi:hypothetical protein
MPALSTDPRAAARIRFQRASFAAIHEALEGRIEARFARLADEWREATSWLSSTQRIVLHRAYQQIIGMGPAAVPFILEELRARPAYWFWALTAITGEDPGEGTTDFSEARERWLRWGEERGYL